MPQTVKDATDTTSHLYVPFAVQPQMKKFWKM